MGTHDGRHMKPMTLHTRAKGEQTKHVHIRNAKGMRSGFCTTAARRKTTRKGRTIRYLAAGERNQMYLGNGVVAYWGEGGMEWRGFVGAIECNFDDESGVEMCESGWVSVSGGGIDIDRDCC